MAKADTKSSYTSLTEAIRRNEELCKNNLPFFDLAREVCRQWSDGEHVLMGAVVAGLLKVHAMGLKGIHPERTSAYLPDGKGLWSDALGVLTENAPQEELQSIAPVRVGRTPPAPTTPAPAPTVRVTRTVPGIGPTRVSRSR
ncbi:MAG: hypothetical protein RSE62_03575 [Citrobacter sp.]